MTILSLATALPDIPTLRRRSQALATLDAMLSPEWEYRCFSFDSGWGQGEELASMRNGSGDEYSIGFSAAGAFIRCFDHESEMSPWVNDHRLWPGLIDGLPAEFESWVNEPAFRTLDFLEATACFWRRPTDSQWHTGNVVEPPGQEPEYFLAELLDASGEAFRTYAEEVHEVEVDAEVVAHVFALRPLTDDLVRRVNPEITLASLTEILAGIGYPAP